MISPNGASAAFNCLPCQKVEALISGAFYGRSTFPFKYLAPFLQDWSDVPKFTFLGLQRVAIWLDPWSLRGVAGLPEGEARASPAAAGTHQGAGEPRELSLGNL